MQQDTMVLLPIVFPVAAGIFIWIAGPFIKSRGAKMAYVFLALAVNCAFVLGAAARPGSGFVLWELTEGVALSFFVDGVGQIFACLTAFIWLLAGVYSFEYLKMLEHEERFLGFYLILFGALIGLDFAATLPAFYVLFEIMAFTSVVLVLHEQTGEALFAGAKYLFYSIAGAFMALFGVMFFAYQLGDLTFKAGGILGGLADGDMRNMVLLVSAVMIVGFGTKAGMFPMHGWLSTAHPAAPAPASAVLSGIITKSGVLALIRVVYFVIGAETLAGTWVQTLWMSLSLATVFMGSMMAYKEKVMKKRLAYSTVSQVSYILFGLSLFDAAAMAGALSHVIFHCLAKTGLFLAAGAVIYETGEKRVEKYLGMGKRMPVTMACFAAGALTLVGIPPASGFVSKWYLAEGALRSPVGVFSWLGPAVLLVSALLTAGYLFPPVMRGFLPGREHGEEAPCEAKLLMTAPMVILALLAVGIGVYPEPLMQVIRTAAAAVLGGGGGV